MQSASADAQLQALRNRIRDLERDLRTEKAKLESIQEIGAALGSTPNLDRLLDLIIGRVTSLMNAEAATLFIMDRTSGQLWSKVSSGGEGNTELRLQLGQGIAGWVGQNGRPVNLKDAYKDPRFDPAHDQASGLRTRSLLCHPLRNFQRQLIGVIEVINKRSGYFTVDDENLLGALCAQAVVSIENAKLYLSAMGRNIELKDAQERLQRKMDELDVLFRLEQSLSAPVPPVQMFEAMLRHTLTAIPSAAGLILLADRRGDAVSCLTGVDAAVRQLRHEGVGDVAARVARAGESFLDNRLVDRGGAPSPCPILEAETGEPGRSVLAVPLLVDNAPIGAIELFNKTGRLRYFAEDDRKLLQLIAGQVAKAVQLQRAREGEVKADRLATIGQLLSGVLHDFKTPMSIISGYVQLMAQEEAPAERDAYSELILRQIERIDRMIREILAFARGESRLLLRDVNLNRFLDDITTVLRQDFQGRNVELVVQAEFLGRVRFDEVKMQRVIVNLARNAIEAMPDGGTFTIATRLEGDWAVFGFSDTGRGIPEEIRDTLFESFVTRGKKDGTGLGLAIVRRIVEEHQGHIEFQTEAGVGTTFVVRLPLQPAAPATQERAA